MSAAVNDGMQNAGQVAFARTAELVLRAVKLERVNDGFQFEVGMDQDTGQVSIVIKVGMEGSTEAVKIASLGDLLAFTGEMLHASKNFTSEEMKLLKDNWQQAASELVNSHKNLTLTNYFLFKYLLPFWRQFTDKHQGSFLKWLTSLNYVQQEIISEQLSAFPGHPFHPMAKTKIHFNTEDALKYSPEFGVEINVIWLAVEKNLLVFNFCKDDTVMQPLIFSLLQRRNVPAASLTDLVLESKTIIYTFLDVHWMDEAIKGQYATYLSHPVLKDYFPELFDDHSSWRGALYSEYCRCEFGTYLGGFDFDRYIPLPVHPANKKHLQSLFAPIFEEQKALFTSCKMPTRASMSFRSMIPFSRTASVKKEAFKQKPNVVSADGQCSCSIAALYSDTDIQYNSSAHQMLIRSKRQDLVKAEFHDDMSVIDAQVHKGGFSFGAVHQYEDQIFPHIKLPVPIRATSQMRYVSPVEAQESPTMSKVLKYLLGQESSLVMIVEPVGAYFDYHADSRFTYEQSRYFSVLMRTNPAALIDKTSPDDVLIPLAALFHPVAGFSLSVQDANDTFLSKTLKSKSIDPVGWFNEYTKILMETFGRFWVRYSVALEAHQQNLVVLFDTETANVKKIMYRDIGGGAYMYGPVFSAERKVLRTISGKSPPNEIKLDNLDITNQLHPRQDALVDDDTAINIFIHTFVSHNLLFLAKMLAKAFKIPLKKFTAMIVVEFNKILESEAKTEIENFVSDSGRQIFKVHLEQTRETFMGDHFVHKCLLKMRATGSKNEIFVEKPNPLR